MPILKRNEIYVVSMLGEVINMNKKILFTLLAILLIFTAWNLFSKDEKVLTSTEIDTSSLHPIKVDGKVGFINQDGRVVIPPSYFKVILPRGFHADELIPVILEEDGKAGYIDQYGEFKIPTKFDVAFPFKEELAMVIVNEKIGYINKLGDYIVKPTFSLDGFSFKKGLDSLFMSEGLVAVQVKGKGWGYINKKGKFVIEPQYEAASQFNEGFAAVKINGLYGYINNNGKMVIKPQFINALPFSEGLASVKINKDYGFINHAGEVVIKEQYYFAHSFHEGLAAVYKELTANGGKTKLGTNVGYINKTGEIVIPFEYEESFAVSFQEGLAPAIYGQYMNMGYIDYNGNAVIPFEKYEQISPFSKGLALVIKDGVERYINKEGHIVYSGK
jgi:hypothetical protein